MIFFQEVWCLSGSKETKSERKRRQGESGGEAGTESVQSRHARPRPREGGGKEEAAEGKGGGREEAGKRQGAGRAEAVPRQG